MTGFPPDVIRLFATHLGKYTHDEKCLDLLTKKVSDGDEKSNKADVANLATTCQAWRRALAHYVEHHRFTFPRITLTNKEYALMTAFRDKHWRFLWDQKVATIKSRFGLVQSV